MRIDLHNHTIHYKRAPALYKKDLQGLYARIVQEQDLDGFAITNYHDIENALLFKEKLPEHIIVGCEYRVLEGEHYIYVVVLDIDRPLHQILMNARLRGIPHFTGLLREKVRPFFLTRIGWGFPQDSDKAALLLDSVVRYFDAIEVLNIITTSESQFARKLAHYYHLTPIGGSDSVVSQGGQRAYTQATSVSTVREFFQAIAEKKVEVGLTAESLGETFALVPEWPRRHESHVSFSPFYDKTPGFWNWTKYIRWGGIFNSWGETTLSTFLQKIPQATHLHRLVNHEKKIVRLERAFVDYLKLKETRRIFALDKPLSGKSQMWEQAIARIHESFASSGTSSSPL